jgi:CyaY protein
MLTRGVTRMTTAGFEALAEAALTDVEGAIEAAGIDADVQAKGDGVLEITFEDGSRMVVNRHVAAQELWVAARSGGFHFRWNGKAWCDTRDGTELFATLSRLVSSQAGTPVVLQPAGR